MYCTLLAVGVDWRRNAEELAFSEPGGGKQETRLLSQAQVTVLAFVRSR
jgi:hypothetical protein